MLYMHVGMEHGGTIGGFKVSNSKITEVCKGV